MSTLRFAIVGCGGITHQNHLPGLAMCKDVKVTALCDNNRELLEKTARETGVTTTSTDYNDVIGRDDVDAVIVATPTLSHAPAALAAVEAGKHVLCEKPIAMNGNEALEMLRAAERAEVRHMTAFTYRFVPAMRYLEHLVRSGAIGTPYHFRNCRLQDWGDRNLGWRQKARFAGTGELGDMLSHRIDFAHWLIGRFSRLVARLKRLVETRGGEPNDLDDWCSVLADFESGATAVMESSKVASGHNESWCSQDYVEINGSEASIVFFTERWNELKIGKAGAEGFETVTIPREFWTWPGSPRDPSEGNPLITFRYDQMFEFVDAIRNGRTALPSFLDGARVVQVMDAAVESDREKRWVEIAPLNV